MKVREDSNITQETKALIHLTARASRSVKQLGGGGVGKLAKPAVDPKIKGRYMLAQVKRMERLARPLGIKVKIGNLEDLKVFLVKLVQLQADKKLEPMEARAFTDTCEVLRKIHQPSDLEVQIAELLEKSKKQAEDIADLRQTSQDRKNDRQPRPRCHLVEMLIKKGYRVWAQETAIQTGTR